MNKEEKIEDDIFKILRGEDVVRNFRVEAGAGAGKTTTLLNVVEWLEKNKWKEFKNKGKNVACVTYTNAAVDVIQSRLSKDSFITPSTIHRFAWSTISPFQREMIRIICENKTAYSNDVNMKEIRKVQYTLGLRDYDDYVWFLSHNDVIRLFANLLDYSKFRQYLAARYPIILIDEYQDTMKELMSAFVKYFISKNEGPQFGLFGDAWQTIYNEHLVCGEVNAPNLKELHKHINYRSDKRIVEALNTLRKQPHQFHTKEMHGEIIAITCNDSNLRSGTDRELNIEERQKRIQNIKDKIYKHYAGENESIKILMITHKMLASQQGYNNLECLGDRLKDESDELYSFCASIVEPLCEIPQYRDNKELGQLMDMYNVRVKRKREKSKWRVFLAELSECAQHRSIVDVLRVVEKYQLVPIPGKIKEYLENYGKGTAIMYNKHHTLRSVLDIKYEEVRAAVQYFSPSCIYSTQHGVKGEEYDNVVFVISSGWKNYQYEKYAPKMQSDKGEETHKDSAYIRNRNLFYVCCSRAKKRLFFFVTIPVEDNAFSQLLKTLSDSVYTYTNFLKHCEEMENKQATSS